MGFNYNPSQIEPYRRNHPKQFLIGTETASAVFTRGISTSDRLRNWASSYDTNYPDSSLELGQSWWNFYGTRPWLSGGFAWTGFDYRGEPLPYGWPSISSQFGIVDTCGVSEGCILHLFPPSCRASGTVRAPSLRKKTPRVGTNMSHGCAAG
jgi:beta-galactosidase